MTPVELVRDGAPSRDEIVVRRARLSDVDGIAALVQEWAAESLLLPRTAGEIVGAIDDFVVATDGRGRVLACAALREYSPSLAELTSVAVSREHRRAKTDRLDTGLLRRAFLGWLRG